MKMRRAKAISRGVDGTCNVAPTDFREATNSGAKRL